MSVTVYIWGRHLLSDGPSVELTGHASVNIDDLGYVSFSPDIRNKNNFYEVMRGDNVPSKLNEFESDKTNRICTNKICINFLDIHRIDDYICKVFTGGGPQYCITNRNCSEMVAEILFEGAGASLNPHKTLHGAWHSISARMSRFPVKDSADNRIIEGIRYFVEQEMGMNAALALYNPLIAAIYAAVSVVDASTRLIWTPGAVEALAQGLARHNR